MDVKSLRQHAFAVLTTADPAAKCAGAAAAVAALDAGAPVTRADDPLPPATPARPDRPALLGPGAVPRRKISAGRDGRVALLHAIAHIEFNAIDLAFDVVARFADPAMPDAFAHDWVRVGGEEAKHFRLIADRLAALDAAYGDLAAHEGLWQAAQTTAHDVAARLAVVPLVLEARGLDVTPAMIGKLRGAGDDGSADILEVIYRDEIGHVAVGRRWFDFACAKKGREPATAWQDYVRRYFKGDVKAPVNEDARNAAGFPARYYRALVR